MEGNPKTVFPDACAPVMGVPRSSHCGAVTVAASRVAMGHMAANVVIGRGGKAMQVGEMVVTSIIDGKILGAPATGYPDKTADDWLPYSRFEIWTAAARGGPPRLGFPVTA